MAAVEAGIDVAVNEDREVAWGDGVALDAGEAADDTIADREVAPDEVCTLSEGGIRATVTTVLSELYSTVAVMVSSFG